MGIIDKIGKNIKFLVHQPWYDDLFWILVVFFVAIGSFSLGIREERNRYLRAHPISFQRNREVEEAWQSFLAQKKETARYFASKNGTVYYPLACPSGDRIQGENRVYFETQREAEEAGYRQSKRCQ